MERPKSFDDIVGQSWIVQYLREHIQNGDLHHFLIFDGPEGVGKTSLADIIALNIVYGLGDSDEKTKAYESVVKHKTSNNYIKKFEMSVEGGKEAAKEVRAEMQATFQLGRPKVIICDECHNLSEAGQDVFLADTEYIDKNVYMIMLTTEIDKLKPTLRSRAVPIHLNALKQSDMVKLLSNEANKRRLNVQNPDITFSMIAEWSECKPRTGLNILNAFSSGSSVSTNAIRELIGYMDIRDVMPLLSSLSGSLTFGLSYISEMRVDNSLIGLVVEALRVKNGDGSYKLKLNDVSYVRENLANVTAEQLTSFLYGLTRHQRLTRVDVINAYLGAHASRQLISKPNTTESLATEMLQKQDMEMAEAPAQNTLKAPKLDDLIRNADIVSEV